MAPLYGVLNVQWAPKALYPQPRSYLQQKATYLDTMKALDVLPVTTTPLPASAPISGRRPA